jgi:hypothetical protein
MTVADEKFRCRLIPVRTVQQMVARDLPSDLPKQPNRPAAAGSFVFASAVR